VRTLLLDLAENGTERAKRKAAQLLELIGSSEEHHEQAQMQADAQPQAQPSHLPFIASDTD
jgi:hypothetical protein